VEAAGTGRQGERILADFDRVYERIVPDVARCQEMMLQGEADVDFYITNVAIDAFKAAGNVKTSPAPYGRWLTRLFPNHAAREQVDPVEHPHPVFSDVRKREAMHMAIHVDGILSGVLGTSDLHLPCWTEFYSEPYKCGIHLWDYWYGDALEPDHGLNVVRWSDEESDALLDESWAVDQEARKEAFCKMAEILDEELPMIWLWQGLGAAGYSERLDGVVMNPKPSITRNIADWVIVE